jgi:uncharacterized protein (UPF0332 family)
MDGKEFINVADDLAKAETEAHWRSAISRAYYAAFHVAKKAAIKKDIRLSKGPGSHGDVRHWLAIQNNQELADAGSCLADLHSLRVKADYRVENLTINRKEATFKVASAKDIIETLLRHFG